MSVCSSGCSNLDIMSFVVFVFLHYTLDYKLRYILTSNSSHVYVCV